MKQNEKETMERIIKQALYMEEAPSPLLNRKVLVKAKEDTSMKKYGWRQWSTAGKVAIVGMTFLLAGSGITYAAANYWNLQVLKDLGLDRDASTQNYLEKNGYVSNTSSTRQPENQVLKATDQDITVELEQVVADEDVMYIYVKATFGDSYGSYTLYEPWHNNRTGETEYSANPFMDMDIFNADTGVNVFNWSGGAVEDIMEMPEDRSVLYRCEISGNYRDQCLQFHVNAFCFNDSDRLEATNLEDKYEGNWDLYFTPSVGTQKCIYTIGKDIIVNGEKLTVESLEVSPISYTLYVSGNRAWKKLHQLAGVAKTDKEGEFVTDSQGNIVFYDFVDLNDEKISKQFVEQGYSEVALIAPPQLYQEDKKLSGGAGEIGGSTTQNGYNYVKGTFGVAVQVENYFTGLQFAGQWIDLNDCEKKIVE